MNQKTIRQLIERLIRKCESALDKLWAERLKYITQEMKNLHDMIKDKDPHVGWTEINRFNRLQNELDKIESEMSKDHSTIATMIKGLSTTVYLESFLRHTFIFEYTAKKIFISAVPSDRIIETILNQDMKNIRLNESFRKERKKAIGRIRNVMQHGILNGRGFNAIAKELQVKVGMTKNQSKRVARFEAGKAMETAAFESAKVAKSNGARMKKVWDATLDLRTRPTHQVLDRQERELDLPFETSGCFGMHPRGFKGPNELSENINCRCVLIYKINGKLPGTRFARNADGERIKVREMSYDEWRETLEEVS